MTTTAAQAIWKLIHGNTERRIIVNYKDGGERRGRIVSLEEDVMILQEESTALFTIQLPNILSVEVIDPDPFAAAPPI